MDVGEERAEEEEIAGIGRNVNKFEAARLQLRLSIVPSTLPGREREAEEIREILEGVIDGKRSGTCIFIGGVPGTGKTATVYQVIRLLNNKFLRKELPEFQYVELNAMKISDNAQAYSYIWKALTGERATPSHALKLLESRFVQKDKRKKRTAHKPVVLLLDEVDTLLANSVSKLGEPDLLLVLYNLFGWPLMPDARLVVIAISNTLNLCEQIMPRIDSRVETARLAFLPYSKNQLSEIITQRVGESNAFDSAAIAYCAVKVASVSGDARRALDLCRLAAAIAEKEAAEKGAETQVQIKHAEAAFKQIMSSSPSIRAVASMPLYFQLFLCALIAELRSTGLIETTMAKVLSRVSDYFQAYKITPVGTSQFMDIAHELHSFRAIMLSTAASYNNPSAQGPLAHVGVECEIRMGARVKLHDMLSPDDLLFALSESPYEQVNLIVQNNRT